MYKGLLDVFQCGYWTLKIGSRANRGNVAGFDGLGVEFLYTQEIVFLSRKYS